MSIAIFWFRRDLRLEDNAGLFHALKNHQKVLPLFILDTEILDTISDKANPRVSFIHDSLQALDKQLQSNNSQLVVFSGKPEDAFKTLTQQHDISAVYANRDYEPYAKKRDKKIKSQLAKQNITFSLYKDHVIFDDDEIVKADGTPYTVFTPYSKKWLGKLHDEAVHAQSFPSEKHLDSLYKLQQRTRIPTLKDIGFTHTEFTFPPNTVSQKCIKQYDQHRDYPALDATSKLGVHFRFGTISIREKVRKAQALNATYLNELIWRDFYSMILNHFPHVAKGPFREQYNNIKWLNNKSVFSAWCDGKTGYPLVDAGMRQLNQTGYMHNRVRMVTASFLSKHLLIDWRWGENYFAEKLLDHDLASNNGGWQWAAGCGTDAAPYFRIFNPEAQQKKFDPKLKYVKRWVAEYGSDDYPSPIIDHKFARQRCLDTYAAAVKKS